MTTDLGSVPSAETSSRRSAYLEEGRIDVASQWQLIWWRFRKHRLAMIGGVVTILIYLIAAFAEFFAPVSGDKIQPTYTYAPPQPLYLFEQTDQGLAFAPYVLGYSSEIDPEALRRVFTVDETSENSGRLLRPGGRRIPAAGPVSYQASLDWPP